MVNLIFNHYKIEKEMQASLNIAYTFLLLLRFFFPLKSDKNELY